MKLGLKIMMVITFLVCTLYWLQLSSIQAGFTFWRDRAELEESRVREDQHVLMSAHHTYLERKDAAHKVVTGPLQTEIDVLSREREVLISYYQEAERSAKDADARVADLRAAITAVMNRVPQRYRTLIANLREAVSDRKKVKDTYRSEVAALLKDVAQARSTYAMNYENFLLLEFNQYVMHEELQRRKELLFRYRWLRPDIQATVGDNGKFVAAQVLAATGYSVLLNKGARDGVELYQKYSIVRNGRTIAIVDIVEVRNDSCEAEFRDLPFERDGVLPQPGDDAVPQRFLAPLARPDLSQVLPRE